MAETTLDAEDLSAAVLKPGALLHTTRLMNLSRMPLMMEFPVPPTSPFLVTTTRSLAWIPSVRSGKIRAGVMEIDSTQTLFKAVTQEIILTARQAEWGNVQPLTRQGLQDAIEHPRYYGLEELQILAHPDTDWQELDPEWKRTEDTTLAKVLDLPVESTPWLDPQTILVIPRDRAYVGFVIEIGETHVVSVVHNAARGIGIATAQ
jgi:hypothetical protein